MKNIHFLHLAYHTCTKVSIILFTDIFIKWEVMIMHSDLKNQIYQAIESISDKNKLKIILQFILGIKGD